MMVCTVLIWFILTVLQESSNLDAIFIVCRKITNKISKLVFSPTPPPLFGQKPTIKKKLPFPKEYTNLVLELLETIHKLPARITGQEYTQTSCQNYWTENTHKLPIK